MGFTIAVVGRPNVGKSTLFNRLIGDRISIVEDIPGITRDRVYHKIMYDNKEMMLIDTGGIIDSKTIDPLLDDVKYQASLAIEEANVIVMLVSAVDGIMPADEQLAKLLYKTKKPVILAVNKVDNDIIREQAYEFYSLGLGTPIVLSSLHGIGVFDILEKVMEHYPNEEIHYDEEAIRFSLIGRPNVGKSSILNALVGSERSIVSDIEGTTRDSINETIIFDDQKYTIVDTAGIRKRGKIHEGTEKFSVIRSYKAIDETDIAALVIDADEGIIEQDKKIIGYAFEQGKGIVLIVNKWDLIDITEESQKEYSKQMRARFHFLQFASIIYVSAKTKRGIHKLLPAVNKTYQNYSKRIPTGELNHVLNDALLTKMPPSRHGKKLNILYMSQVDICPPTFVVFVNNKELFHFSYRRYLINIIRDAFDLEGTPIKIVAKERKINVEK